MGKLGSAQSICSSCQGSLVSIEDKIEQVQDDEESRFFLKEMSPHYWGPQNLWLGILYDTDNLHQGVISAAALVAIVLFAVVIGSLWLLYKRNSLCILRLLKFLQTDKFPRKLPK